MVVKIKSKEELEGNNQDLVKLHQPFSNLFNAYTKAFNKKYDREGSLFKVRFKRERIKTEEYLKNVIIYIHLNPVKHKFIENYLEYKYSSINAILSEKPTSLMRKEVIELFNDRENMIFQHNEMIRKGNFEDFE